MRGNLARSLDEAVIHLKERGYVVLQDSSFLTATIFNRLVELEGVESLPLYINCEVYSMVKGGIIYDVSGTWHELIREKLSE